MPKLTLNDCVILALINDLSVKGAYLDRILGRWDLRKAEQQYWFPVDPSLTLSSALSSQYSDTQRTQKQVQTGGIAGLTLQIPTGGRVVVNWTNPATKTDVGYNYGYVSTWDATFTQPILKGGGLDNASYNVKVARLTEEKNILSLRTTISTAIGTAITNFRTYASSKRSLENRIKALESARRTYEVNKAMIEAGKTARTELVQSEADIANREYDVVSARNKLDSDRLTLLSFLNIDKGLIFDPVDESESKVTPPPLPEAVETALKNRTDYITAVYNQQINKWAMDNANRNQMWQLDFVAGSSAGYTGTGDTYYSAFASQNISKRDWNVGLNLTIPLTNLPADKRAYIQAKNTYEKGEWSLRKLKTDIEIAVQNAIRNVEMQYISLQLARQSRKLAVQKVEIEQEKFKAGRTTNFQLLITQNDLKTQEDAELAAITSYLGALNSLDEQLGITPERWGISIKREDDAIRIPQNEKTRAEEKVSELNAASVNPERKAP